MLLLFSLIVSVQLAVQQKPLIGLWPGLDKKKIDRVIISAYCPDACEFKQWEDGQSFSALFVDGHSAVNTESIADLNLTIPIVLMIDKPNPSLEVIEDVMIRAHVTTILGYHSRSPYKLQEDGFDLITNNLERSIGDIWLHSEKMKVAEHRSNRSNWRKWNIAFFRKCAADEQEEIEKKLFNDMFNLLFNHFEHNEWRYKLSKIDDCYKTEDDIKNRIHDLVNYELFILHQSSLCEDYYPEISFMKGSLSTPIMAYRDVPAWLLDNMSINKNMSSDQWRRTKKRFLDWTEDFARSTFHGRGICEICETLQKKEELKRYQETAPYFKCVAMELPPPPKDEKNKTDPTCTEHSTQVFVLSFCGLIGLFIILMCVIALYFPLTNSYERHFGRGHTE